MITWPAAHVPLQFELAARWPSTSWSVPRAITLRASIESAVELEVTCACASIPVELAPLAIAVTLRNLTVAGNMFTDGANTAIPLSAVDVTTLSDRSGAFGE